MNNNDQLILHDDVSPSQNDTQTQTQTQTQEDYKDSTPRKRRGICVNSGAISIPIHNVFSKGGIKVQSGLDSSFNTNDKIPDTQVGSQPFEATQDDFFEDNLTQRNTQKKVSPIKPLTMIPEIQESQLSFQSSHINHLNPYPDPSSFSPDLSVKEKQFPSKLNSFQYSNRGFGANGDRDFDHESERDSPSNSHLFSETQPIFENDGIIIPATQATPVSKRQHSVLNFSNDTQEIYDNATQIAIDSPINGSPSVIADSPMPNSQAPSTPFRTPLQNSRVYTKSYLYKQTPISFKGDNSNSEPIPSTQAISIPHENLEKGNNQIPETQAINYNDTHENHQTQSPFFEKDNDTQDSNEASASYFKYFEDTQVINAKNSKFTNSPSPNKMPPFQEPPYNKNTPGRPDSFLQKNPKSLTEANGSQSNSSSYSSGREDLDSSEIEIPGTEVQPPNADDKKIGENTDKTLDHSISIHQLSKSDEVTSSRETNDILSNSPDKKHEDISKSPGVSSKIETSTNKEISVIDNSKIENSPSNEPIVSQENNNHNDQPNKLKRKLSSTDENEHPNSNENPSLKTPTEKGEESNGSVTNNKDNILKGSPSRLPTLKRLKSSKFSDKETNKDLPSSQNTNSRKKISKLSPQPSLKETSSLPPSSLSDSLDQSSEYQNSDGSPQLPINSKDKSLTEKSPNIIVSETESSYLATAKNSRSGSPIKQSVQSLWVKERDRYHPAKILSDTEVESLLESESLSSDVGMNNGNLNQSTINNFSNSSSSSYYDKVNVMLPDSSWRKIKYTDTILLDLCKKDQVKYRKQAKVLFEIVDLFDSKTEKGKNILKDQQTIKQSQKAQDGLTQEIPKRSGYSRKHRSSIFHLKSLKHLTSETNKNGTNESTAVIYDNAGNDYAVLREISGNKRFSSYTIAVPISDLYLTPTLGKQYQREKQRYQPPTTDTSFSNEAGFTTTEEAMFSSFSSVNRRKSARISEGGYYESSEDECPSISDEEKRFAKNSEISNKDTKHSNPTLIKLGRVYPGIFSGCIFTITHAEKKAREKKEEARYVEKMEKMIQEEGGIVLSNGFKDMIDLDDEYFNIQWAKKSSNSRRSSTDRRSSSSSFVSTTTTTTAPTSNSLFSSSLSSAFKQQPKLKLKGRPFSRSKSLSGRGISNKLNEDMANKEQESVENTEYESIISPEYHFAAVLANDCTRTPKYLEGLAIGVPCLSWQFVTDCLKGKQFISGWSDYVLSAGVSNVLGGIQRSLNITNFQNIWQQKKSLEDQFSARKRLFLNIRAPIFLVEDVTLARQLCNKDSFPIESNYIKKPRTKGKRNSHTSSGSTTDSTAKVFRSLLLMIGCEPKSLFATSKVTDVIVDKDEGAIIIFNCKEHLSDNYSTTSDRTILDIMTAGNSLDGKILRYNREWIIQCIINQRLV